MNCCWFLCASYFLLVREREVSFPSLPEGSKALWMSVYNGLSEIVSSSIGNGTTPCSTLKYWLILEKSCWCYYWLLQGGKTDPGKSCSRSNIWPLMPIHDWPSQHPLHTQLWQWLCHPTLQYLGKYTWACRIPLRNSWRPSEWIPSFHCPGISGAASGSWRHFLPGVTLHTIHVCSLREG